MDFKDSLKDIKTKLEDEIEEKKKEDLKNESIAKREKRLQEEFMEFIEFNNIKKLNK